jgi:sarcosine oxidase
VSRTADVIIAGLGAVGSAAAWRLAAAGHRVLGFDRWAPPHGNGSTHGESRVTRVTAWEGAPYVALVRRAHALWSELEAASGERLFVRCGGVFVAAEHDVFVAGSRASAEAAAVPFELLSAPEVRARWPHVALGDAQVGFHDPGAGVLFPERILRAEHHQARAHGAELRMGEGITSWRVEGEGVRVTTGQGEYRAASLILCTGAWMPETLAPLGVQLRVERTTLHWFTAREGAPPLGAPGAPVVLGCDDGERATVVFPAMNGCVKVATHHSGEFVDADRVDRTVRAGELGTAEGAARRFMPAGIGAPVRSAVCLYTVTPDRALHHRQASGAPAGDSRERLQRLRLQVQRARSAKALAALATGSEPPVSLGAVAIGSPG